MSHFFVFYELIRIEEEYLKTNKLENVNLKYELDYKNNSFEKKIKSEIEKAVSPLVKENIILNNKLNEALNEIDRLKSQISAGDNKEILQ